MALLPEPKDATLVAVDHAIEKSQSRRDSNGIGMSAIGRECDRDIWLSFRWATPVEFDAKTIKRFEDGHKSEDIMAERLRMVDGIDLITKDPNTGRQIRVEDFGGHFSGYVDGVITGLLQAPKTSHCWEHKCSDKIGDLEKAKKEHGEKQALAHWNSVYYWQAQCYMHYLNLDRHYLTCSSSGTRETISVRTEFNQEHAIKARTRAERIIKSPRPLQKLSENSDYFGCRWCSHKELCHGSDMPRSNCRTCLHSTPEDDGSWSCARWGKTLSYNEQQNGCPAHLFIPELIKGEQIDAGYDWVKYRMPDGSEWIDGEQTGDVIIERDDPCRNCGSVRFKLEEGKGPHAAHLRCDACGRGGLWLSKAEAETCSA